MCQTNTVTVAPDTDFEWARITPDKVVVATTNRAWVHRIPAGSSDPFAQQMAVSGSVATTQKLLDGAIAFARATVSFNQRPPALTRARWVWQLAGSYYLTHFTPQLMEEAGERFVSAGRERLAQWAAQKVKEERGHDQLALLDIQSLGYKAEALVETLVPPAAVALVNFFTQSVQTPDPIECVGYGYTMERLVMGIGEEFIQMVETLLPAGTNATRCLHVHSRVGSDLEHTKETVEMVAGLTPEERARVAAACYETALLCFSPPKQGYISEVELQRLLKPFESP
ncbi:hypothetical protein NUACC21_40050 [Scytonema sp. NUACC21]